MMVYFRKRIKLNLLNKINQEMVKKGREILGKNPRLSLPGSQIKAK